jgi:hypothetical protein
MVWSAASICGWWPSPATTALAPVHVKAARGDDGVTFTWIRRTRIDGDSWVGEVPLGEDSEQYALDVLSDGGVVRTLAASVDPTPLAASQFATLPHSPSKTGVNALMGEELRGAAFASATGGVNNPA